MTGGDDKYDIAISFLREDDPLSLTLYNALSVHFTVFVYSKKQEEVAASDGVEKFRRVFRSESRLVVVLYRDRWGDTPYTRVERTAIEERLLAEGFDFLGWTCTRMREAARHVVSNDWQR